MYSHGDLEPSRLAPDTANMLTDALYEIGRGVFGKHQYEDAAKWLERAFGVIGERNLEELDHDVVELRMSIMNYLLRAYLGIGDQESLEKARGIVSVLELENGDKMVVQLLKLEVLTADGDSEIDVGQYSSVVSRMIRTVVLTDASFKTIMHHVHKIKGKSSEMAGKILEKFIQTRILTQENAQWIEKVVVTQLWISLESVESATNQPCEKTLDLLNLVLQNSRPFNAPATHAAQTLLWKRIEIMYGQGKYDETEAWCSISLHPLFEKAGDLNKAKIARKLILCAVAKQDHNAARKVFFEMSESARNAPMTRYLMYKSALRDAQPDFAAECLDVICRQSDKDVTLLYACVIEAQSLSDRRQSILALQKVLEMYDYGAPPEVNLPALLRSTIRLLVQHLGGVETFNEDAMGELCKVFEAAAAQATKAMRPQNGRASSEQTFTVQELEWFSRNSYNISLKYCAATHPSCLIRLLDKCIQFIALLQGASPRAEGGDGNGDLVLRLLLCHYLASCAATVLARSTDSIEESLTAYMTASTHVKAFRTISAPLLRTSLSSNNGSKSAGTSSNTDLGAATLVDLAAKRAQLLRYELESALKRRDWDGLDALWDDCFDNQGIGTTDTGRSKERASSWYTRHLEALADLALVIHAELSKADTVINKNTSSSSTHFHHADTMTDTFTHRARILGVLQRIANTSWQGGTGYTNADVVRLARWIRCLFQLCIDSSVSGSSGRQPNSHDADAIPLQCVEQATTVVSSVGIADRAPHLGQRALTVDDEDGGVTSRENAYPLIEAEWLAATAFNRGIEFFCAGDDQRCRSWCDRALGLAQAVEKGRRACGRGRGGGLYGTLMGKYRGLFWGGEDE
ncbi:Tetratricopeptide-like helical [Macrophomina phaseolina MS6]|uniref:Tetratricopeptide-like helical n=1 Tax=Macrophomina phaseolina (strain MS6) TaxID=1126212 RepID=K2R9A8_MACPH|nr:Tetratricopeptide-like helical [Macrophomina phaseolina MS6]